MPKKLSPRAWLERAVEKLGSRKAVAERLGRSVSTISDILRGRRPGKNLFESARDLAKGKRQPTPPPPKRVTRKAASAKKAVTPILSQRERVIASAQAELASAQATGVERVVIYVNMAGAGRSFTLGAHGGINPRVIAAQGIEGFVTAQGRKQRYDFDWDNIESVFIEPYFGR